MKNTNAIASFSIKKHVYKIDGNDHLHNSFDLYFLGKKVASYNLDPWSMEEAVEYFNDGKEKLDAHAKETGLYDAVVESYKDVILKHVKVSDEDSVRFEKYRTTDCLVSYLAGFFNAEKAKEKAAKKNQLKTKKAFVYGVGDEIFSAGFKKAGKEVKDMSELTTSAAGRAVLENAYTKVLEEISAHAEYQLLNTEEQLKSLGLIK